MLILGSLPGDASLAAGRYYAHPRNLFWRLAGAVIGDDTLPLLDYDARLAALRDAGVGLWDTIASARRSGSLDTAIRAARPAPLRDFMAGLPNLRAIGFNGARSAAIGRKALATSDTAPSDTAPGAPGLIDAGAIDCALIDLPSSSPAHAALSFAAKRERWLELAPFLR